MRGRIALVVVALLALPAAVSAQQMQQTQTTQTARSSAQGHAPAPNFPIRPQPNPPNGRVARRPSPPRRNTYPVVIDGGGFDRYVVPPARPPVRRKPIAQSNGEQVFETHSTEDNR